MTREQLMDEVMRLRSRVADLEAAEIERGEPRESERRAETPLRSIFENAKGGMFIVDMEGCCVNVNPAGCALTGYTREEIVQSDITPLLFPQNSDGALDKVQTLWKSGGFIRECRMCRKNGAEVWVEISIIPFVINRRELALEIVRDVTDRKCADDALQKAHDELERCMEERTHQVDKANWQLKREIEERKRAEEELKRTKEYLENVIENSVDAIGIVDRHGRFILWNRRAAEIYGYRLDELAGKSAFDLYADPVELDKMLDLLRRNGVVREYEIPMKKQDGSIVAMDISISLLKDEHGMTIGSVCVARDLSERKRGELELKRAKDELSGYTRNLERQVRERTREISGILKYTPAMVYIKDIDGCYTLINSRYEELFQISNEEIRGKSDHDIFPAEYADLFRANDLQVLAEGRSCQVEEHFPQRDGVHTYLSVKFPLYDEGGSAIGVCGISTDITELKRAQLQLKRLSGSIMAGQEKERAAIARELHDELGQVLTALRIDAVWMLNRLKDADTTAADRARTMCDLIDKTIDEVRGIALRLRPSVLDDLGLIAALEWYTADLEKRSGIACILDYRNIPKVDDIVATAAYRIAQEAMTNVVRHSCATHVEVSLQMQRDTLMLTVTDNGRGFNTKELSETECLGVAGMRERASLAGGALEIQSRSGKGTQVCCKFPMPTRNGASR
jgi:PAS domain S-box-containing protein